ncbi:MAG TPA: fatty acid desaturase family protein [Terriglobales bacterium]
MIQTKERFRLDLPESGAHRKVASLSAEKRCPMLTTAEIEEELREDIDHPHAYVEELPDRPPIQVIRELSRLDQFRAGRAIVAEWLGIAVAIALCARFWSLPLYLLAVVFIGARQHALLILGHEASHFTLFKRKWQNDWLADLVLYWPMFLSVGVFRYFHRDHHRYLGTEKDKNRELWRTHTYEGTLEEDWQFPKSVSGLLLLLFRKLAFVEGIVWVLSGIGAMFVRPEYRKNSWLYVAVRSGYYGCIALLVGQLHLAIDVLLYWIIPYCTWHIVIQYIRIICEHSAIPSSEPPYHLTRTTVPSLWERILIIPRNIGYHHEHHWYPSVPFYNLPRLHAVLTTGTKFGQCGAISRGVMSALCQCLSLQERPAGSRALA